MAKKKKNPALLNEFYIAINLYKFKWYLQEERKHEHTSLFWVHNPA